MDNQESHKNPCPDCSFCQYCCDSRCAMCRTPHPKDKKKKEVKGPKVHRPLFLKY